MADNIIDDPPSMCLSRDSRLELAIDDLLDDMKLIRTAADWQLDAIPEDRTEDHRRLQVLASYLVECLAMLRDGIAGLNEIRGGVS